MYFDLTTEMMYYLFLAQLFNVRMMVKENADPIAEEMMNSVAQPVIDDAVEKYGKIHLN